MKRIARQGDITFLEVDNAARTNLPLKKEGTEVTVALGEATGHHHTLYSDTPMRFYGDSNAEYIELGEDAVFKHQEHHEFRVPGGTTYKIIREREYDYFERVIARVRD